MKKRTGAISIATRKVFCRVIHFHESFQSDRIVARSAMHSEIIRPVAFVHSSCWQICKISAGGD